MAYAVKEIFLTLQGEGVQAGARAVFLRFAGCNLWSGREQDRATAQCNFCDTDFVGTDGEGGGKFQTADELAAHVESLWGEGQEQRARGRGSRTRRASAAGVRAANQVGALSADKAGSRGWPLGSKPAGLRLHKKTHFLRKRTRFEENKTRLKTKPVMIGMV